MITQNVEKKRASGSKPIETLPFRDDIQIT